jgi:hypothetical protein
MENGKALTAVGTVLFVIMAILLAVGTTSAALFLTYGVLAMVGVLAAILGKKISDREQNR